MRIISKFKPVTKKELLLNANQQLKFNKKEPLQ